MSMVGGMTKQELAKAIRKARRVYVTSPCTGAERTVARRAADDVQHFAISKAEARRVLLPSDMLDAHYIAFLTDDNDLYIG